MIHKKHILLCLLVLCALAVGTAGAQTITMANPSGIAERDILVYYGNGTLAGFYNSTSVITLDGDLDYIFTMKPSQMNPVEDPTDWFTNNAVPFVQSNLIALIAMMFLIGLVWARA